MTKEFQWKVDSQIARNGSRLIKGEIYKASDFPADVVDEWIKTGVAKKVGEKLKTKEKE